MSVILCPEILADAILFCASKLMKFLGSKKVLSENISEIFKCDWVLRVSIHPDLQILFLNLSCGLDPLLRLISFEGAKIKSKPVLGYFFLWHFRVNTTNLILESFLEIFIVIRLNSA